MANAPEIFKDYFVSIPERFTSLFDGVTTVWEPLNRLSDFMKANVKPSLKGVTISGQVHIEGSVEIGEGSVIEHGAVILGPTILGKNCHVRAGAYVRGNVVAGDGCVIGHATEVINAILLTGVRADHFNYVGDSILGNSMHFGAGAKVANLRFDENPIIINDVKTDRKKLGIVAGDQVQLGVNVSVGPGVFLKRGAWIVSKDQLKSGIYGKEDFAR